MKGHLRTMRSCLAAQIGFRVPVRHPLIAWMVRHVANLVCWCASGHDGRTAYQRAKGRDFRTRLMHFGEFGRFKNRAQESLANIASGSRFHSSVFVVVDSRTGQYMVCSDDAIKLARTVARVPELEKWDKDMLSSIKLTPFNIHTPKEPEVIFRERAEGEDLPPAHGAITRRLYLRPSDFI